MSDLKLTDLIPIKSVSESSNKEYITLPYNIFKQTFPELPDSIVDKIYYQKSIVSELIYYNPDEMLLFSTHIFIINSSFKYISPNQSKFEEDIIIIIEAVKKELQEHNFTSFCLSVPEVYQREFISKIIDRLSEADRNIVNTLIK